MPYRQFRRTAALTLASALAVAGACTNNGGSVKAFCRTVTQGENPLVTFGRYDPTDPTAARATLQKGVARLEQMRTSAPKGEVRDALGTLIAAAQKLSNTLEQRASNPASGAQVPDFSSEADQINRASSAVVSFASQNCGVRLDSNAPVPSTSAQPTSPPASTGSVQPSSGPTPASNS